MVALLALAAPNPLYLVGEKGKVPEVVAKTYAAAGKPDQVQSQAAAKALQGGLQWITNAAR